MKHYVYKIIDPITGQYYIGSRSHKNPQKDDYMGSMVTWIPEDKNRLTKQIIKDDFKTREDAIEYESILIEKHIDDKLNENYNIPTKGFHTVGLNIYSVWVNRYGKNKADEMWGDRNKNISKQTKNKTYTELYGEETAIRMKKERSSRVSGDKNPSKRKDVRYKIKEWCIKNKIWVGKNNPMYGSNRIGSLNPTSKQVKCECHNKIFGSWKECSNYHDINYSTFCHNLRNNKYKHRFITNGLQ